MKKVLKYFEKAETFLCVACFILMAGGCFFQVLNRNIFKIPLSWVEELSRFAMIWMALFGSEIGLRVGKQMSVDAIVNRIHGVPRKVVEAAGCVACFAFAFVSAIYSVSFVKMTYQNHQVSSALNWPMWMVYLILPVSLFLMAAFECWNFFHVLTTNEEAVSNISEDGVAIAGEDEAGLNEIAEARAKLAEMEAEKGGEQ